MLTIRIEDKIDRKIDEYKNLARSLKFGLERIKQMKNNEE